MPSAAYQSSSSDLYPLFPFPRLLTRPVTVPIVPALIGQLTLLARFDNEFLRFYLSTVQIPDMLVDPLVTALRLLCHIYRQEGIFFVLAMDHNEHFADFELATGNNIVLEACVFDVLVCYFRGILYLVNVVACKNRKTLYR